MTIFIIILYILIGFVTGCGLYVYIPIDCEDHECGSFLGGLFWPLAVAIIIIYYTSKFICTHLCNFFKYLKNEGFHYCKEDISSCCGQCKYMYYCNNYNEINRCYLYKGHTHLSSTSIPCEKFKKHWLWRFRIRYKWDIK